MKITIKQLAAALAATDIDNLKHQGYDYQSMEFHNQLIWNAKAMHVIRAINFLKMGVNPIGLVEN